MTSVEEHVDTKVREPRSTGVRFAVIASVASLLLSLGTLIYTVVDDTIDGQQVENRLACLELPGPNDCGVDGD